MEWGGTMWLLTQGNLAFSAREPSTTIVARGVYRWLLIAFVCIGFHSYFQLLFALEPLVLVLPFAARAVLFALRVRRLSTLEFVF